MTSPTDSVAEPHRAVGSERGDRLGGGVAALETQIQWMRFCEKCESEERFVAGWACDFGLIGCCSVCGAEALVRFTRTNSEAA
jgi:hypothetical protein